MFPNVISCSFNSFKGFKYPKRLSAERIQDNGVQRASKWKSHHLNDGSNFIDCFRLATSYSNGIYDFTWWLTKKTMRMLISPLTFGHKNQNWNSNFRKKLHANKSIGKKIIEFRLFSQVTVKTMDFFFIDILKCIWFGI